MASGDFRLVSGGLASSCCSSRSIAQLLPRPPGFHLSARDTRQCGVRKNHSLYSRVRRFSGRETLAAASLWSTVFFDFFRTFVRFAFAPFEARQSKQSVFHLALRPDETRTLSSPGQLVKKLGLSTSVSDSLTRFRVPSVFRQLSLPFAAGRDRYSFAVLGQHSFALFLCDRLQTLCQ